MRDPEGNAFRFRHADVILLSMIGSVVSPGAGW